MPPNNRAPDWKEWMNSNRKNVSEELEEGEIVESEYNNQFTVPLIDNRQLTDPLDCSAAAFRPYFGKDKQMVTAAQLPEFEHALRKDGKDKLEICFRIRPARKVVRSELVTLLGDLGLH